MKKIAWLLGPTLRETKNRETLNNYSEVELQQALRELTDGGYITVDDEGRIWLTEPAKEALIKGGYILHEDNQ